MRLGPSTALGAWSVAEPHAELSALAAAAQRIASRSFSAIVVDGAAWASVPIALVRALLADDEAGFDFNLLASPKDKDAEAESKPARGAGRKSTAAAKQSAAVKRGTGTPGSSGGRASGGRGSGGRGRGGRGKKPGRKRKAALSDDEDDEDDDEDDDDLV